MSNWFYYNEKGEKIAVTGGQLKWLAKNGNITPGTMVETEGGKTAPAKKVKGLTFGTPGSTPSATAPPEPAKPIEAEIYGVATSPPKPNPFTAPMPKATDTSVVAPPPLTQTAQAVPPTDQAENTSATTKPASTAEALGSWLVFVVVFLGVFWLFGGFGGCSFVGWGSHPSAFVGDWGISKPGPGGVKGYTIPIRLELSKDGTGIADGSMITWKREGDRLYLIDSTSQVRKLKYKVSGSQLTLTNERNEYATFQK